MKRREFITLLGGAAVWPLAARSQQRELVRRIGVLLPGAEGDQIGQDLIAAFRQGLQELGWTEGRNLRIDYRWTAGDPELYRKYAAELASLAPDVIVTTTTTQVTAVRQVSTTVPIVMAAGDAIGRGLVESLARPRGNTTGFEGRSTMRPTTHRRDRLRGWAYRTRTLMCRAKHYASRRWRRYRASLWVAVLSSRLPAT
jgi:putative ABC transport system substrate-binding protein